MSNKTEPRIVFFDLETLPDMKEAMKIWPSLSDYPGQTLKAQISSIICFGYKVFGDDHAYCKNAWDYPAWKKNVNDDKKLCEFIYEKLYNADCVVTQNGKRFDWKFVQTRLLLHGMPPLPRILHVDTKVLAKSNILAFNNRLGNLGKFFIGEEKLDHEGWDLWVKVSERDPDAMKRMSDYCTQDVLLLEKVFKLLRPFAKDIPNYNIFSTIDRPLCPNCGSTRLLKHDTRTTRTRVVQRYICKDCGTSSSTTKEDAPPKVL